ncbi:MAG TPA: DUF2490 domain-containing protein [Allosphingosinicella sp.]|jgi:hypothetical protein|uniref:DUF2490 domain-containing protein n=1 Tax=Allosphingosinicella sp. TaxID=2823234 RepID=UPI002F28A1B9
MTTKLVRLAGPAMLLLACAPAAAADDGFEFWLNPSVSTKLDARTSVELESAHRFRSDAAGGDTHYARLWLGRQVADGVKLSLGAERRHQGPGHETRLLQQVSYGIGKLGLRTRLEQRSLSDDPRTAWRLRQRVGTSLPLRNSSWSLAGNAEGFFTLRAAERGGQTGFTALRTFVGVEREFGPVELSLGYLRQQTIRDRAPDRVGHAPFLGVDFSF